MDKEVQLYPDYYYCCQFTSIVCTPNDVEEDEAIEKCRLNLRRKKNYDQAKARKKI